jgi:hypothetical protein
MAARIHSATPRIAPAPGSARIARRSGRTDALGQVASFVEAGRVDHDAEGQDHHHRDEGEAERDQPLVHRQALVPVVVGGVEGAAGGGEQAARHPPGQQEPADGRATPLLAQLGPDERVDHAVGQPGADDDPDHPDDCGNSGHGGNAAPSPGRVSRSGRP